MSAVVSFVTLEINSDQPVRVHTQNDKSSEKEDNDKKWHDLDRPFCWVCRMLRPKPKSRWSIVLHTASTKEKLYARNKKGTMKPLFQFGVMLPLYVC